MFTDVQTMDFDDYRQFCAMAAAAIPTLNWRHSGLGVLQAYLVEGSERELRLHIWHERLRRPGIEQSGLLHDHRFDLTSRVLYGVIRQVEYQLHPHADGAWQLHSVVHAREAFTKHQSNDGLVTGLSDRYYTRTAELKIHPGHRYRMPKREFHGTYVESDMAITLLTKSNQDDTPARILAPYGKEVVHAFAEPLPRSEWQDILVLAQTALIECWKR